MAVRVVRVEAWRLDLPIRVPYKVSSRTFTAFDPIVARVTLSDGRVGFGEAVISPGYGHELPESGWAFVRGHAARLVGMEPREAIGMLTRSLPGDSHAVTVLGTAIEMACRHPALRMDRECRIPLLAPIHATSGPSLEAELEELLAEGYGALKVKVGFEAAADTRRVREIQQLVRGRATLRLDANRGFSREDGIRFAGELEPGGIELFEQPCAMDDWDANTAVAAVSTVPVMLDESIYDTGDIRRAGEIPGVGYVKIKLKKFGTLDGLVTAGRIAREAGLGLVMGDGVATEIICWMEAAVAPQVIDNAGEMNGYLKLSSPLLRNPPPFERGSMVLPAGYWPELDDAQVNRAALDSFDTASRSGMKARQGGGPASSGG
ncbi:mandelate racemase/muconate lactonizing enzyme family protein [Roseomonas chloroacetimidivorans]|uniref:mandelate racemase/muconate lactonizing enzyme family protein n=1 Tax=Roseomonas chloroacetimidivorans TaxID=1766656 RepID=UPI003C7676C5